MPCEKKQLKYKCMETCCVLLVRSDKWAEHCCNKLAFKYSKNLDIKYKTVQVKESISSWTNITKCNITKSTVSAGLQLQTLLMTNVTLTLDY